ncbi:MAG: thiol peroxidase [Elusimicrobia bacterium]|nr:MAG: thiol peroxidase [Elusimicrobiota bacterium]
MAQITLKGNQISTSGNLPAVGSQAPEFTMVKEDLSETSLSGISGRKVFNIFPSIDTGVCAASVRQFNQRAAGLKDTLVYNISKDLPFAMKRFCGAEGIKNAQTASVWRSDFAQKYGLEIVDGPLKGLCSRVVLVLDASNKVLYAQQVPEITTEPDYDAALKALA